MTSDTVLIKRHAKGMVYLALTYGVWNFIQTKRKGSYIYPFLPWTDWKTPAIIVFSIASTTAFFLLLCMLDEKITGRSSERKKKLKV